MVSIPTCTCTVCCVALLCCLFDLACFFLPSFSHLSLKHVYSMSQKKVPFPFRSVPFYIPFRSVSFFFPFQPFRSVPYRSVHFRSNRLPRANSFSARHEFVCKIHCVRWRSIARLFSTTRSRDGFFLP